LGGIGHGAWSIEHRDKAGKARKARKGRAEDRGAA